MKLECKLVCHSASKHLAQVLTGFTLLDRSKAVRVTQECRPLDASSANAAHLRAVLNGGIKLHYDMHDSGEIDAAAARTADFYFKRSYARSQIPEALRPKVHPFGFNYAVYPDDFDRLEIQRILRLPSHWKSKCVSAAQFASRSLERFIGSRYHVPTAQKMHAPPDLEQEPRVLFMTRAWDPAECGSADKKRERESINEVRAGCIALLRREFGRAFTGGFEPTSYALSRFKELVVEDPSAARQGNYLATLRKFPICVATTGLHGSIGWKTGEYVSFSKAIVSEPLNYAVPGGFRAGTHYLEFSTPERCVEQAVRLFCEKDLRCRIMEKNHAYYLSYLKPDVLVLRTLAVALGTLS